MENVRDKFIIERNNLSSETVNEKHPLDINGNVSKFAHPIDALKYMERNGLTFDDEAVNIIATNPNTAYDYARDFLRGRFELGEPAIAKRAEYAYYYARDVLKSRFKLGEEAIAKSAYYSIMYAGKVLKGRFELGEPAISTSPAKSIAYARLIGGKFPLGEPAIATNPGYSCVYAILNNERFKMGERVLKTKGRCYTISKYENHFSIKL